MTTINSVGDACPIPAVKARRAIRESGPNAAIQIIVDNDIAVQNLEKMAGELGLGFTCVQESESEYVVNISKGNGEIKNEKTEPATGISSAASESSRTVVVISSDTMGRGDNELGASLLKMFIFTLAELDKPPHAILFYNAGVRLTSAGSGALEDLERLSGRGSAIFSCGACLSYYGLQDKLAVGEVTNMLKIVELQTCAAKIIRP